CTEKNRFGQVFLFIARTIVEKRRLMSCSVTRPKNLLRGMDVAPPMVLQKPAKISRRGASRTTPLLQFS
ncbi:MAG: hypothetical protein ACREQ2_28445, partial [Candidatus Binatia bacterium]